MFMLTFIHVIKVKFFRGIYFEGIWNFIRKSLKNGKKNIPNTVCETIEFRFVNRMNFYF